MLEQNFTKSLGSLETDTTQCHRLPFITKRRKYIKFYCNLKFADPLARAF